MDEEYLKNVEICDCDDENMVIHDMLLPDYVVVLECIRCGHWVEYDTEADSIHSE